MLTPQNTTGYTLDELAVLNAEYACRRAAGEWAVLDEAEAESAFGDEVAGR